MLAADEADGVDALYAEGRELFAQKTAGCDLEEREGGLELGQKRYRGGRAGTVSSRAADTSTASCFFFSTGDARSLGSTSNNGHSSRMVL